MGKVIALLTALLLVSCRPQSAEGVDTALEHIGTFEFRGHLYDKWWYNGDHLVTHSPDCKKCLNMFD